MQRVMPIGTEFFAKLRENHYYFVDKTTFLSEFFRGHADVTLITRPRRFGKTLLLSMTQQFLDIEGAEEHRQLFEGLQVMDDPIAMAEQGTRPVVFVTLRDWEAGTWADMQTTVAWHFGMLYGHFSFLQEDPMEPTERRTFETILQGDAPMSALGQAFSLLSHLLAAHYGRKVVLLIDEYDAPLQCAWSHGYYEEAIGWYRTLFSSALKSNPALDFSILTGVLRIAKESIFSGLNNLEVSTVFRGGFADVCGYTKEEVQKIAQDLGMENKIPELTQWYDGYNFQGTEIYNPWSVNNYFKQHGEAEAYWVNTSGNDIIHTLLAQADEERWEELRALLTGGTVQAVLQEGVIYNTIGENSSDLYTLLLQTGYLKAIGSMKIDDTRIYELAIPNREIRSLFQSEIMRGVDRSYGMVSFYKMGLALQQGNAETFQRILQGILRRAVSAHDAAKPESFYHGLMLGCALFYEKDYRVRSNRESGYGRFDLAMLPKHVSLPGVIMEFKAVKAEEELEQAAQEACQQIETKAYVTELESAGCPHIWYYGIAFCKKHVLIRMG
ncbi:MAG: AAA family ATPase [Selenomonas sp.]|nr:AAA family ATPase [Selenomonas sp.]MCI7330819.1 ATP-binding protein [Selenomonadaceae bacterium]MDD7055731.1 AAA family ATPase [Selenomonadaceae bacterium]MDY3916655.1 AAA family ATPase [Selenomonadaceae bacterium]